MQKTIGELSDLSRAYAAYRRVETSRPASGNSLPWPLRGLELAELWSSAVRRNSTNGATRDQDRRWDLISHWGLKYSDSLTEADQQPPDGAAFASTTE